jgi:hypothetical protein
MLFLDGGVNAGAQFLLRKAALVEELGEQRVVRFGDMLDELALCSCFDAGSAQSPVGGDFLGELAGLLSAS